MNLYSDLENQHPHQQPPTRHDHGGSYPPPGTTTVLISAEPPKPAVRQRIQKTRNHQVSNETTTMTPDTNEHMTIKDKSEALKPTFSQPINAKPELVEFDDKQQGTNDANINEFQHTRDHNEDIRPIKQQLSLPMPTELPSPDRPYPKKVLFIVANEFCERFSYYGLRTVLVLYFKSVLGFSDASSTVSFHIFATLCYLTPILGAILGDSIWGKFKTILYLSIVYLFGEIILLLSSIFWDFSGISVAMTFLGLILIGIGTGGIKPCVSALGGDQFLPHEERRRENFFSLFYGAINLGALFSVFLTPMLRSHFKCVNRSDCYPVAFGVPCVLMLTSIIFFLLASKRYTLVPLPKDNVILAFCQCSWLAFKRKLAGQKLPNARPELVGKTNHSLAISDNTSSSNLSMSSNDDTLVQAQKSGLKNLSEAKQLTYIKPADGEDIPPASTPPATENDDHNKRDHWLYLAADRFDMKSIEDFRSVWRFILLFLPTPVYWCLFDQQGSLWTLQATRMDGRIFDTGLVIEPDQISVANPLLLLASIPLFQLIVYPSLNSCNILNSPIQKMTAGGLLAAATFVTSAIIEVQIQKNLPNDQPNSGYANLLLVNGLSDCSIVNLSISYVQIPDLITPPPKAETDANASDILTTPSLIFPSRRLQPLSSRQIELLSADSQNSLNNYKFQFKLSNDFGHSASGGSNSTPATANVGCPFDPNKENEFSIGPLADKTVKLMYLEQGNGKLTYKLFNDSLGLPPAGKARVRILYEFFGSYSQAMRRQFTLVRQSNTIEENQKPHPELQFNVFNRNGQVLISDYIDVAVPSKGGWFTLKTNDSLMELAKNKSIDIKLEPGSRSLILVHQKDATSVVIKQELLQDNNYRISILYQLVPYLMISMSELMFSVTGMELAYAMAPITMKSLLFGFWNLSVAMGNLLTVAVESIHPFANVIHDFLFYAALMTVDALIFAIIGYYYQSHNRQIKQQHNKVQTT